MRHFGWLDAATKLMADEVSGGEIGGEIGGAAIINRLAKIIFIQIRRSYAKTQKNRTICMPRSPLQFTFGKLLAFPLKGSRNKR